MATNGNEQQMVEQLEKTLRGVDPLAVMPPGAKRPGEREPVPINVCMSSLIMRLRAIADLSNSYADALQRGLADFENRVDRELGRK
jgi:hypothetical protein